MIGLPQVASGVRARWCAPALRLLEEDERRRELPRLSSGHHGQPVHAPSTREA